MVKKADRAEQDKRLVFLLHRASRAAIAYANLRLQPVLKVSLAQLATLSHLAQQPGCSMSDIAKVLDLNKSAVSSMVARLEARRLVRREPNPRDKRAERLFMTAKAVLLRERSYWPFVGVVEELGRGFSAAEQQVVLRFLSSLVTRFGSEASEEEGP